jgi:hypothetical protein
MIQAKQTVRSNRIVEKGTGFSDAITHIVTKNIETERPRRIYARPTAYSSSTFDTASIDV